MPPRKGAGRRAAASPSRDRAFDSPSSEPGPTSGPRPSSRVSASLFDGPGLFLAAEEEDWRHGGEVNPRSFPFRVKQLCWEKAEKVKGRDPDRWRRDSVGNIVFRKLVGCPGCLCHDYDHILPYSKGGKSTLENCQVLQTTVNRSKGNRTEISKSDLIQRSAYCRVSGRDMDLIELSAYGNTRHDRESGGCNIQ